MQITFIFTYIQQLTEFNGLKEKSGSFKKYVLFIILIGEMTLIFTGGPKHKVS